MKERPILTSTPMVQAILDGRKTQTRRRTSMPIKVLNVQPNHWEFVRKDGDSNRLHFLFKDIINEGRSMSFKSAYGMPGDVLYVREAWATSPYWPFVYKTDFVMGVKWKPSIHMPKDAARIWIRLTNVRVERLHAMEESDAMREGIICIEEDEAYKYDDSIGGFASALSAYRALWRSINGAKSWEENPWVYVLDFEVLSTTGKPEGI